MTETQSQNDFEPPASNLLPFPNPTATAVSGNQRLYTAEDLRIKFTPNSTTTRSIRDLVAKVRQAYSWLDEVEFKHGENFTQFCVDQIKAMKDSGLTQKQWIAQIQNQKPVEPMVQEPSELVIYEPVIESVDSIIGGLSIITKATEKREVLKGELVTQEQSNDESWHEFNLMMTELQAETEAATEDDELEFQLMRKRNAAKWLERKAILEQDKLRILQGQIAQKTSVGNG